MHSYPSHFEPKGNFFARYSKFVLAIILTMLTMSIYSTARGSCDACENIANLQSQIVTLENDLNSYSDLLLSYEDQLCVATGMDPRDDDLCDSLEQTISEIQGIINTINLQISQLNQSIQTWGESHTCNELPPEFCYNCYNPLTQCSCQWCQTCFHLIQNCTCE